jgi:anthranilate synthase
MTINQKISVGTIITQLPYENPFKLYQKLSNKGNDISLLFESKSPNQKYERKSIIVPTPAIKITGKKEEFTITALTDGGKEILTLFSKKDFPFAKNYEQNKNKITGIVEKKDNPELNEEENAKLENISFVIKTILAKFDSKNSYAGLYGAFAYDFARNFYKFEQKVKEDNNYDFELFLPTRVLVMHDDEKRAELIEFTFNGKKYEKEKPTRGFKFKKQKEKLEYDIKEEKFLEKIRRTIADIHNGRVMQCVLSRSTQAALRKHPIDSYEQLREINPSPYSFYYNFGGNEILYGASPEMHIKINNTQKGKEIEIRPIAGTIMRSTNPLEDALARRNLLNDEKEIREHTMLVDLARHEIYKLCESESVEVTDLYTIEHYPNIYHLVSGVKGILKKDINAIDALLVTLPAGTLSGAPKLEAMKMIEEYEGSKRGFYGGASGIISFNEECNTGITIRSVHVKNNKSTVRGGAGIVALSLPEKELKEIKLKISKAMSVLGVKK